MAEADLAEGPALHVIVVGFHHKKGCQVEFSYPPLVPGNPVDSQELPELWKNLPSLALPDGSHNYEKDTIYFHLPSLQEKDRTVYGVSCYRQIDAKDLKKRGADVTRNSVQKSVCVLSKLPLYGLLTAKLELITHAYFDERDFSQVSLLEETYRNLNSSLNESLLQGSQALLGMSTRTLVLNFKHKVLLLYKLMMLERKVLFFGSPVKPICTTILEVLSLFPGMVEFGLQECASFRLKRRISQSKVTNHAVEEGYVDIQYVDGQPDNTEPLQNPPDADNIPANATEPICDNDKNSVVDSNKPSSPGLRDKKVKDRINRLEQEAMAQAEPVPESPKHEPGQSPKAKDIYSKVAVVRTNSIGASSVASDDLLTQDEQQLLDNDEPVNFEEDKLLLEIDSELDGNVDSNVEVNGDVDGSGDAGKMEECNDSSAKSIDKDTAEDGTKADMDSAEALESEHNTVGHIGARASQLKKRLSDVWTSWQREEEGRAAEEGEEAAEEGQEEEELDSRAISPSTLPVDDCGFPLSILTKGMLCLPYLSLQYYDIIQDVNIRGFVIGATNVLYKQKRQLFDVIVEVNEGRVDILDPELRRQLSLTTADLRFADYLVRCVTEDSGDVFLDDTAAMIQRQWSGTGWEGGDEWIRGQFRLYLLSMLASSQQNDDKIMEDFGLPYIHAWKTTHNYKQWRALPTVTLEDVMPGHPFQGQLSVGDMKLRLSQSMQSTERGKKVNAALVQTGKVVAQTGKAVGGALVNAKSAVSSWFSGLANEWRSPENHASTPPPTPETPKSQASTPVLSPDTPKNQASAPALTPETQNKRASAPALTSDTLKNQASTPALSTETPNKRASAPALTQEASKNQASTPAPETTKEAENQTAEEEQEK